MTKKGIKMNISKCLKNYDLEKSESTTTEIRGQHKQSEGFKFIEENEMLYIVWFDEKLDEDAIRLKHLSIINNILSKHGFGDYILFDKDNMRIMVNENGFEQSDKDNKENDEGETV